MAERLIPSRKKKRPCPGAASFRVVSVPFGLAQGRNTAGLNSFLTNHFLGWCLVDAPKPSTRAALA
jgi:hypothetical protein